MLICLNQNITFKKLNYKNIHKNIMEEIIMVEGQKLASILTLIMPFKNRINQVEINKEKANLDDLANNQVVVRLQIFNRIKRIVFESANSYLFKDNFFTLNSWKFSPPEKVSRMGESESCFSSIHPFSFLAR